MEKQSFIPLILLLVLAALKVDAIHPAAKFWYRNLQTDLPKCMIKDLTSLPESSVLDYVNELQTGKTIKNPSKFCADAGLLCDPNADITYNTLDDIGSTSAQVCSKLQANIPPRAMLPKKLASALFPKHVDSLLDLLTIPSGSRLGEAMRRTYVQCGGMGSTGCVGSIEDLVTLASTTVGANAKLVFSRGFTANRDDKVQQLENVPIEAEKVMACHEVAYPFKLYYCHEFYSREIKVYKLQSSKAYMICHTDETPKLLEMTTAPEACHWMPKNNMLWYY